MSSLIYLNFLIMILIVILSSMSCILFKQFLLEEISIGLVDIRGALLAWSFILFVFLWWDMCMHIYFVGCVLDMKIHHVFVDWKFCSVFPVAYNWLISGQVKVSRQFFRHLLLIID